MTFPLIALAVTLSQAAGPQPATAPAEGAIVQVGLFRYGGDGTVQGVSFNSGPSFESMHYVSGTHCGLGSGTRQVPADASDVWRVSGRTISRTNEQAVVQVDWQRVVAQGQPVSGPSGSTQYTLANGDRVLLDRAASNASTCADTSVLFEVRYAGSPFSAAGRGRAGGGGRGGMGNGGGSGLGAGGSERVSVGPAAPSESSVVVQGAGGASASGTQRIRRFYSVRLWLVRSTPGKPDETWHQRFATTGAGAAFAFAPVAVETERGPALVQISGSFSFPEEGGPPQLVFETKRRVSFSAAGDQQPRDGNTSQGSNRTTRQLPGADEVLSFELPPAGSNLPAIADRFEVRVQIGK